MELCIKCKKRQIEIASDPYCETCWKLTEGYLLQIPPIKVLEVMLEGEKTYKEIMEHQKIRQFHKKSIASVAISLKSLIRREFIYMSNKISGTYAITELGISALDKIKN